MLSLVQSLEESQLMLVNHTRLQRRWVFLCWSSSYNGFRVQYMWCGIALMKRVPYCWYNLEHFSPILVASWMQSYSSSFENKSEIIWNLPKLEHDVLWMDIVKVRLRLLSNYIAGGQPVLTLPLLKGSVQDTCAQLIGTSCQRRSQREAGGNCAPSR